MVKNKQNKTTEQSLPLLREKSKQLEKKVDQLSETTKQLERSVHSMERTFIQIQKSRLAQWLSPAKVKQSMRNVVAYILGRRNIKRLYSRTYKRKQASNDLIPYVRLMYDEGFAEQVLEDLQTMYDMTSNHYEKRAIAQELALYYANKETKQGATIALYYIKAAKHNERDIDIRRQLTIIEAECYGRLNKKAEAKQKLHEQLQREKHRDIYLALANTETTFEARLYWLNKTLKQYDRQPIIWNATNTDQAKLTYETLHETTTAGTELSGPKISVILPAYNAANSIHIAIESLLNQTWTNIELLIVDDCSTDNTYNIIKQYAKKDDRIKMFKTKQNSGPYVARNIALHAATGEFVTVNDADDWSHREKLAVQINHLLEAEDVIANTSELARLTTDFSYHRRGTRGKYIFSNMSSILFRRKEVIERLGYWDEVRFAADGEFKRRLIHEFGKEAVVDLETGPLSLPEQATTSLTGSSVFGYSGFFMGARKEYVDSFSHYHRQATSVYYPFDQRKRLFPVPEPMLPTSKRKARHIDVIIVANFYDMSDERVERIKKQIEKNKQMNLTTGLVQLYDYDVNKRTRVFNKSIRNLVDGTRVQMIVYGERVTAEIVLIHTVESLQVSQQYVAHINNRITVIIIDELPKVTYNRERQLNYNIRQIIRQSATYFSHELRLYPLDELKREGLQTLYKRELGNIQLSNENWILDDELEEERYGIRLRDWLVEQTNYEIT